MQALFFSIFLISILFTHSWSFLTPPPPSSQRAAEGTAQAIVMVAIQAAAQCGSPAGCAAGLAPPSAAPEMATTVVDTAGIRVGNDGQGNIIVGFTGTASVSPDEVMP